MPTKFGVRSSPKIIIIKLLKECVTAAKRLNALGPKATYGEVTTARGMNEIAAHQLALFAPRILKLLTPKRRNHHAK